MYRRVRGGLKQIISGVTNITLSPIKHIGNPLKSKTFALAMFVVLAVLGASFATAKPVSAAEEANWVSINRISYKGKNFTGPTEIKPENYYRYTSNTDPIVCTDPNDSSKKLTLYSFIEFQNNPTIPGNTANTEGFYDSWKDVGNQFNDCEKQDTNTKIIMKSTERSTRTDAQATCLAQVQQTDTNGCIQREAERLCQDSDRADRAGCISNQVNTVSNTGAVSLGTVASTETCPDGQTGTPPDCAAAEEDMCDFSGNPMTWFICPILDSAVVAIGAVDGFITSSLTFGTTGVFENDSGFYAAWNSFRVIATALLVLAGLVIVISQALGFEFLDAYTLRKSLPRLLVAVVGISLSWYLMKYAIQFINVFGHDVRDMIYGPFRSLNQGFSGSGGGTPLGGGALFLTNGLFFGALVFMGPIAMLSFVGTALLAILVGFLIILVRNIAITLLIILAPIAIVCYILPNTEKVWKLWYTNFVGLLLVFPIIMALIAAGHVFSLIALTGSNANETTGAGSVSEVIGIVAYFIPYFILPLAFRFATGIIGNIAGFVNNKNSGAFDGLKNFRQKQREGNTAALKQGFNRTKIGGKLQEGRQNSLTKRSAIASGALPGSRRYRSELSNAEFGHMAAGAAEAIKNNPSAAANDDANKVAQYSTSKSDFVRRYTAMGRSKEEAVNQLAFLEQAYGTNMGSTQMKHTAATAALSSNSSTDKVSDRAQWMRNAVNGHVMTSSQASALVKQSGSLMSSAGFGDLVNAAEGRMSDQDLLTSATKGFNPANSHRMRKGQAQEMAQEVHRQIQSAAASPGGTSSAAFAKAVADAAGMHDVMNGMTPDVREEFANYLNGAVVAGVRVREHEQNLESTSNPDYLDRRKTWATGAVGAAGGTPGGAPVPPSPPPSPGGAPSSDARLKRDISTLQTTEHGIQLYTFKYLWSETVYVGVMAQDLVDTYPEALSVDSLGYYRVDYSKLGLKMMTLEEWHTNTVETALV